MPFCPKGKQWSNVWQHNGINRCFFDSVSSTAMLVTILGFGVVQCVVSWHHGLSLMGRQRWPWLFIVQILLTVTLLLESIVHMILQDVYFDEELCGSNVMSMFMFVFAYVMSLVMLGLEKNCILPPPYCRRYSFTLLVFWGVGFARENLAFLSWWNPEWWWDLDSDSHSVEFGLWLLRWVVISCLFTLGLLQKRHSPAQTHASTKDTELKSVLTTVGKNIDDDEDEKGHSNSAWSDIGRKLKVMMHFVWPGGNRLLQLIVIFCLILLAGGRVVNVFVPVYGKKIVNSLSGTTDVEFQWKLILIYCTLLYLKGAGGGGMLNQIRGQLWINVQQFTSKRMEVHVFMHLHSLSLRWHLERKTGKVLRIVERGTASMNMLLAQIAFQIIPTLVDCVIAIVFFITTFSYLFGLIILACVTFYIAITFVMTEVRTKYRRSMNKLDNEAKAHAVDSLINFETVKYYGATDFEISRYRDAISKYQEAEWKNHSIVMLWQWMQNTIFTMGYVAGLLLCAWAVVKSVGDSHLTVGDYVLFGTYLTQLFGPLNNLGAQYRVIQQSFIDVELMFDLLDKEPEVKDAPEAEDLVITEGKIEFQDVCFHYDQNRPILKDINFTVLPGQTYALVGHTGSGKSTIVRLLFRFYDVSSGVIKIDGKNIALVTQNSLRNSIGVVPQETVLFNKSIRYNIRYGCVTAEDQAVEDAAVAAEIHSRIQEFPYQYETVVGERGLKLSGGEKQRVAIARTLLKAPAIVLLDEATSALDTKTERNIQAALSHVCENRTTLIIAHRLSTIVHAHQILVMREGQIIERGTHDGLLAQGGHYASMWQQQLTGHDTDLNLAAKSEETDDDDDDDEEDNSEDNDVAAVNA